MTDAQHLLGDELVAVDEAQLSRLASLALSQVALEAEVEEAEARVKDLSAELRHVSTELIPDLMDEIGVELIRLKTGERVEVKKHVKAGIAVKDKEAAHAWLRANNFGSLIKNEVTVSFGKGEEAKANKFYKKCAAAHEKVARKESVHAQTLGAFVREQLAAGSEGADIPMDLFGVYAVRQSKIIRPSNKKGDVT